MLGSLTNHAIAAMTRERLKAIDALLLFKIRSQQNVTPLERQVRFLARTAHLWMSLAPHIPDDATLPSFTRRLSQQTVFGSVGPDFPKFAAQYASNQQWLYETIHNGNPDPDRKRVLAHSTAFLMTLWDRSQVLINSSDAADKDAELNKARAYVLGHVCHIAADVVSSPFVNGIAWELGERDRKKLTPEEVSLAIELSVARFFQRAGDTGTAAIRGEQFKDWWPRQQDLPKKFFDAFREALEATYGPGARPKLRPAALQSPLLPPEVSKAPQVSKAYWTTFSAHTPPSLSVGLLEDGYSSFRTAREMTYSWGWGDWLAATALMFIPPIAAYPLIIAMPHARALFRDGTTVDGQPVNKELGWFGVVMAPLATSLLAPVMMSIYISASTNYGVGAETIFGWISGGLHFIFSIVFLATMTGNPDPVFRWLLLFILPFAGLLAHSIFVLTRPSDNVRRNQLALGSLIPCIITAVYILFHLAWHQSQDLGMNGWLKPGSAGGWGNAGFIGGWVLWAVLLVGGWFLLALLLRQSEPTGGTSVTGTKRPLRLFGHSTLLFDPNLTPNSPDESNHPALAAHYFPTNRRPLLNLRWEGAGDLWFRSDRNVLRFSTTEDGTGQPQEVLSPAAPMTAAEFAVFLRQAVKEGAAFTSRLQASLFAADDFDYILPPGEVFADLGDEETTVTGHDTEALKFIRIAGRGGDATVLYHAPRTHLASYFGTGGALFVDRTRAAATAGAGTAVFNATGVTGDVSTRFGALFQPGDVIVTSTGAESRIVAAVQDDQHLTVTMPFTGAVGDASQAFQRAANTRETDTPAGTVEATDRFRVYQGTGLDAIFLPGDIIRALPSGAPPEQRIVVQILSGIRILVDKPFSSAVADATPCLRAGRAGNDSFQFVPTTIDNRFGGSSLMDRAADLGAILAMGAASRLMGDSDRQAVVSGPDEDRRPPVQRVYQVFRNWNLSERRINEWQMLIGGNAISEKKGAPALPDSLQPDSPDGWTSMTPTGEAVANELGWIPLFDKWLAAAGRPSMSTLSDERIESGVPANRKLSEGIAFLLDLPMPV